MRLFDRRRLAAGIVAIVLLAACNGGGAQTQLGESWMTREAKVEDLLYLTAPFYNNAYVFALPSGNLVGSISGLSRPSGACADNAGHVFITNTLDNDILEYRHGGTSPIATLNDPEGTPFSCSVDETTGNLAVGDFYNDVSIYSNEKAPPATYSNDQMTYIYFMAYDGSGNLFVEGLYGNGYFRLAELPKGGSAFSTIKLDTSVLPASIQWDGTYLAVTNGDSNTIYRMRIVGSEGTAVTTTKLRAGKCHVDLGSDWIENGTIVAPLSSHCGLIGLWAYPAGGPMIAQFAEPHESFFGVTVSPAK